MARPLLSAVDRPRSYGFGCALDDDLFRLAVGPGRGLSIETAPLEPNRVNTASNPEELAETEPTFARSQFSGGEGLFRAHVEGAAADRFWDSKNVSVAPAEPGEFPEITLLHTTANIETSADTGLRSAYDDIGGALYMCEGTVLRRSADPTAATPTFTDDDPHLAEGATTVEDVTVLGDEVYAALGANGIHKKTSGTWAHWGDIPTGETYVRVWASKGRIVASTGASLYELPDAGGAAPSALHTLASGETWQDVCDGGDFILAAASDGYVYAFDTDTGSMVLATQTLFEGETPRCLGQTQGVVAVGTSSGNVGRLYTGGVSESGQVVDQQLVKQWGESGTATDQSPRWIIGTRESLLTAQTDGTDAFLWRFDVTTAGLSRSFTVAGSSGLPRGLHVISGKAFVTVDGAGMFRQTDTYAAEGYLIGPLGDFVSASDKSWVGARLETGGLTSGMAVELYYTTNPDALGDPDSSSWIRVVRRISGDGDPGEMPLTDVIARSLAGMVKLVPNDGASASPAVRSFGFRSYPTSGDEDVIVTLPVNVGDQIERRGRGRVRISGLGERTWAALMEFDARPVKLTVFKPDLVVRGIVESIGTPVQAITSRGSTTLVSQVRVKGRKVIEAGATTGAGSFDTYLLFDTATSDEAA